MNSDANSTSTPVPTPNSFSVFGLSAPLMKAMDEMGFTSPTPIQEKALPLLLGPAQDFIGLASTGTGKTAAFGVPLIEKIDASLKSTQGLVLSPTRELAMQVSEQLQKLGKYKGVRVVTIYGGSSYTSQIEGVRKGAHIVVATPGRLVDFLEQKIIKLNDVKTLILDEADEMISMGFKDDLDFILKCTHNEGDAASGRAACKTWLFSATMSRDIRRVADQYLENPITIEVAKVSGASELVKQVYYTVKDEHKNEVISRLLQIHEDFHGIIFCQTKVEVIELEEKLQKRGFAVASLHGDKQQREREITLRKFRAGEVKVLTATDVAARGLDVKDLTHVINHSLPWDVESYIHRIGRTGRNGKEGIAISLINPRQVTSLRRLQNVTRKTLEKGKIPSADEVAMTRMQKFMTQLSGVHAESRKYQLALQIFQELVPKDASGALNATAPELLARVITALHPDLLAEKDYDLDFLRGAPLETRNPRGDQDGRTLSGGSRNFNRGDREDRGPRRDSRESFGPRGGGFGNGGGGGGYNRGADQRPARAAFNNGGERRERPTLKYATDSGPSVAAAVAPRAERSSEPRSEPRPAPVRTPYSGGGVEREQESFGKRNKAFAGSSSSASSGESSYPQRDRGPRFDGFEMGEGAAKKPRFAAGSTAGAGAGAKDRPPVRRPSTSAAAGGDEKRGGDRPPIRRAGTDHPGIKRSRPAGQTKTRFKDNF
jgi:ATP-dependent RNA helicase DeaD